MKRISAIAGLCALLLAGCAAQSPAPVVDRTPNGAPSLAATAAQLEENVPTHTVKRGETLYSIASENRIDPRDLAAWNGITDPTRVQSGQVLRLRPPQQAAASPTGPETRAGVEVMPITGAGAVESRPLGAVAEPLRTETAGTTRPSASASTAGAAVPIKTEPKAMKYPYSDEALAALQRGETPRPGAARPEVKADVPPPARPAADANDPDHVDWSWPVAGRVLAGFSEAKKGIEIAARNGEPVLASAAGRVVYSGSGLRGYGKLVIIKHNEKYLSAYGFNRQLFVKEGDKVTKGQKIAAVGLTDGGAPRLHFEIRQLGKPVDPQKFLPER